MPFNIIPIILFRHVTYEICGEGKNIYGRVMRRSGKRLICSMRWCFGVCFVRKLNTNWHTSEHMYSLSPVHASSCFHYNDVIMGAMAFQITSPKIVYSAVYSGAYQRKHQSYTSLAFVRRIHRWPVISPHKGPVTRKMFPFDDVIIFSHTIRP